MSISRVVLFRERYREEDRKTGINVGRDRQADIETNRQGDFRESRKVDNINIFVNRKKTTQMYF